MLWNAYGVRILHDDWSIRLREKRPDQSSEALGCYAEYDTLAVFFKQNTVYKSTEVRVIKKEPGTILEHALPQMRIFTST